MYNISKVCELKNIKASRTKFFGIQILCLIYFTICSEKRDYDFHFAVMNG